MERKSSREDIMPQLIEAARAGAAREEIARRVREHYFPDETDHDLTQAIHIRERVAAELADSICEMAKVANCLQEKKDAISAKERELRGD